MKETFFRVICETAELSNLDWCTLKNEDKVNQRLYERILGRESVIEFVSSNKDEAQRYFDSQETVCPLYLNHIMIARFWTLEEVKIELDDDCSDLTEEQIFKHLKKSWACLTAPFDIFYRDVIDFKNDVYVVSEDEEDEEDE